MALHRSSHQKIAVRIDSTFALPNDCGCLVPMLPNRGVQKWKCEQKPSSSTWFRSGARPQADKCRILGEFVAITRPCPTAGHAMERYCVNGKDNAPIKHQVPVPGLAAVNYLLELQQ
jgi:hypothetical protein